VHNRRKPLRQHRKGKARISGCAERHF